MITQTVQVNSVVLLTIANPSGQIGEPAPVDLTLLQDGAVVVTPTVTVTDVGARGLYNFSFTPASTGIYTLYAYGAVQARIEVVTKDVFSFLQNLEDESLGSWLWSKTGGTLSMVRRDGTPLATFSVVDNLTIASRELIS